MYWVFDHPSCGNLTPLHETLPLSNVATIHNSFCQGYPIFGNLCVPKSFPGVPGRHTTTADQSQNFCWNSAAHLEFVTGGVELLRGHCTDIPADQGSWKRICAFCSFWRLFTMIMTKSVEVFQFSFWKTKLLIFFLLHKNQTPGITMQYGL